MAIESAADPAGLFRRVLLVIVALGMAGLGAELALIEHYEEWQQLLPLIALGAGFAALAGLVLHPSRATVRLFQLAMAACVLLGAVGIVLHVTGNVEFELEMKPDLGGSALLWESLRGATPALAPGALAQTGLLGLLATWRHPAMRRS